jgi:HNH endonuclease
VPTDIFERILAKTVEDPVTGCKIFTGYLSKGYGKISVGSRSDGTRRNIRVHIFAYERLWGPVPEGHVLDHLCRVRACWEPAHLQPVTNHENVLRGDAGAFNGLKTHCPKGHPYDDENTVIRSCGRRRCRICWLENGRKNRPR